MKRAKIPTSAFRLGTPNFKSTPPPVSNLRNLAIAIILVLHLCAYLYFASGRNNGVGCLPLRASSAEKAGQETLPLKFMVYRLIGNNMPPLQCPSQLLWNTQYALKHEGPLADCGKRWVLNQILNSTERALLIDTLVATGYGLDDIIIRRLNITQVAALPQATWVDAVTAQNEGRNAAVEDGVRLGARWILPLDGNHFLTQEAWGAIRKSAEVADSKGYKYFKIPTHRLHKPHDPSWVTASSLFKNIQSHAPLRIESQLAFRHDADLRFKTGMTYGQQNKLELLGRACGSLPEEERCGCSDLGQEGQPHPSTPQIAAQCGYSLRLWFYPCEGIDPDKVFNKGMYRKRARSNSTRVMYQRVKEVVRNPKLLES